MRTIDARLDVIRNGAKLTELISVSAPSVRCNASAAIKTALRATVLDDSNVNWITDRISPVLIIDGEENKLGEFLPATVTRNKDESGISTITFEAYDKSWLIQTCLYGVRKLSAGVSYITAIELFLNECGVSLVLKTPNSATLTSERTWEPETNLLSVVNELLAEINYNQLHFDANGYAVLSPKRIPTIGNVKHTIVSTDVKAMLLPNASQTTDIFNAPNNFIVVCSNPDIDEPLVAEVSNTSAVSPLSIQRRGRKVTKYVRVNNVASQEELNEYAKNLLFESTGYGETVQIHTALRTNHGLNDVVALSYEPISGIYTESEWDMSLQAGGIMKHTLKRVVQI